MELAEELALQGYVVHGHLKYSHWVFSVRKTH